MDSETLENISILLNSDYTQGDFPRHADYGLGDFETIVHQLTLLSRPTVEII